MNTFNPYNHFGFLTNRIARLLSRSFRGRLEEMGYDFPTSCIGILADLWAVDGVNQKDLGISLVKTKSSINKMLKALEIEGFIQKKDDPNDGRGKLIFLTSKGKALQMRVEQHSLKVDESLLNEVSQDDLRITKMVLAKYYEMLCTEQRNKTTTQYKNLRRNLNQD